MPAMAELTSSHGVTLPGGPMWGCTQHAIALCARCNQGREHENHHLTQHGGGRWEWKVYLIASTMKVDHMT